MKNFIVYSDDGSIKRYGECVDSDFDSQAGTGENVIELAFKPNTKVSDGKLVDVPVSNEELNSQVMRNVRANRNFRLNSSDWTQMSDSPLSDSKKNEWKTYRKTLRDLPATVAGDVVDFDQVIFPTPPSST
tara:strand:- start:4529 stop:4921 length:393 start_codon:yes stop_codon:yes gene_type:complete